MKECIKIIFLDIDGVLNGYDFIEHIKYTVWKNIQNDKIKKFIKSKSHFTDIDKKRVKRLSKICKKTGAKIVLSSSVRNFLLNDNGEKIYDKHNGKLFWDLMDKYKIEVIDKTPRKKNLRYREDEIIYWLSINQDKYDIKSFIILDDEDRHLSCFTYTNLVKTSYDGYYGAVRNKRKEYTGLTNKHVKIAIKKLRFPYNILKKE